MISNIKGQISCMQCKVKIFSKFFNKRYRFKTKINIEKEIMNMKFQGKVAIVTGGAGGIGGATVKALV